MLKSFSASQDGLSFHLPAFLLKLDSVLTAEKFD